MIEPAAPRNFDLGVLFLLIRRQRLTSRGRAQDRKRVAGGQDYEVRYEAKKTGT